MEPPNLLKSLSTLSMDQLRAYFADQGWREYSADGRTNFEKELEPGESAILFVPTERSHPRFRSHLQNLLFSLSVIEKREPANIAKEIADIQIFSRTTPNPIGPPMHEIATLVRGLAQECIDSDKARGKVLELAKYLLASKSMTVEFTSKMADELWETARSDQSYIATTTIRWLEINARNIVAR